MIKEMFANDVIVNPLQMIPKKFFNELKLDKVGFKFFRVFVKNNFNPIISSIDEIIRIHNELLSNYKVSEDFILEQIFSVYKNAITKYEYNLKDCEIDTFKKHTRKSIEFMRQNKYSSVEHEEWRKSLLDVASKHYELKKIILEYKLKGLDITKPIVNWQHHKNESKNNHSNLSGGFSNVVTTSNYTATDTWGIRSTDLDAERSVGLDNLVADAKRINSKC